jgi:hypothetical protein
MNSHLDSPMGVSAPETVSSMFSSEASYGGGGA